MGDDLPGRSVPGKGRKGAKMTNQRTRKLLGMITLLFGLLAYIVVVVTIATTWLPSHWAIHLLFFAVAGIAWAIPLKPFMAWMNQGAGD